MWAKSFAEANGDEAVAKAKYLQVRASELAQADWMAVQHADQMAEAVRIAEQEAIRLVLEHENEAKPKGICPNCSQVILLDAGECSKCHAQFGVGAAWQVLPLLDEAQQKVLSEQATSS